mmetsp:Transcript_22589/g.52636  ORF Transcript_22589/g.52636 Transcript_22589/m.52636 type:complete len:80 (-) Transcript_22589:118-357(-)
MIPRHHLARSIPLEMEADQFPVMATEWTLGPQVHHMSDTLGKQPRLCKEVAEHEKTRQPCRKQEDRCTEEQHGHLRMLA